MANVVEQVAARWSPRCFDPNGDVARRDVRFLLTELAKVLDTYPATNAPSVAAWLRHQVMVDED